MKKTTIIFIIIISLLFIPINFIYGNPITKIKMKNILENYVEQVYQYHSNLKLKSPNLKSNVYSTSIEINQANYILSIKPGTNYIFDEYINHYYRSLLQLEKENLNTISKDKFEILGNIYAQTQILTKKEYPHKINQIEKNYTIAFDVNMKTTEINSYNRAQFILDCIEYFKEKNYDIQHFHILFTNSNYTHQYSYVLDFKKLNDKLTIKKIQTLEKKQ